VDIGVLEEDYSSEWYSPSFAFPKKNRTIRVVTDFRKLNLLLKHTMSPFPIHNIGEIDMIPSMKSFTFASALDLNMFYYHVKLIMTLMLKSYVQLYSQSENTNAYPWVSRLPGS
jgi:hypothetical protein